MTRLDRLAVFVDYQNAYMGARQAFGTGQGDPHTVGQFDPLGLARLIARRQPNYPGAKLRRLVQVSIYRGLPDASKSPTGYAAARRQVSRWQSYGSAGSIRLDVQTRPLDYRTGKPREKGIDVLLALDLAFGAADRDFDVVVLFSGDSDLLPALERADASGVACESATWRGGGRRLSQKPFLKCEHQLTQLDYTQVEDPVDYR
ncbi:MAG: NYN domain-containing protein [Acidimicrobiaceae bacterium]|nr:NYN domain-containing protein [Acidimicrobiaceae bacterium]